MKRSRDACCKNNGDHLALDRKQSKCNDCGARLVATCSFCEKKNVSYSNITNHEEAAFGSNTDVEANKKVSHRRKMASVQSD